MCAMLPSHGLLPLSYHGHELKRLPCRFDLLTYFGRAMTMCIVGTRMGPSSNPSKSLRIEVVSFVVRMEKVR